MESSAHGGVAFLTRGNGLLGSGTVMGMEPCGGGFVMEWGWAGGE